MMKAYKNFLFFAATFFFVPFVLFAQNGSALPVARTVFVEDVPAEEGYVVVFNEDTKKYTLSDQADSESVFGVTALAPALVFETQINTIPVVTEGVTSVRIQQGSVLDPQDLLVTSSKRGIAELAQNTEQYPFAIVLGQATSGSSVVLAEINPERARALLLERKKQAAAVTVATSSQDDSSGDAEEESVDTPPLSTVVRMALAAVLALGALGFLLYSFRVTIAKAIVSIGRNPRARGSIMALSFGNIVFALILCAFILFVAIAVLVLPV